MNKKLFLVIVFIFSIITGCIKKRDLSQNILIIHFLAEPLGLHPTNDNNSYQRTILGLTQKKLLLTDIRTFEIIPDLLDTLPEMSDDSLTFYFKLKPNIKWDDGTFCTAKDIAFTLKVIKCPFTNNPSNKSAFENIASIKLYDNDSLKFSVTNHKLYFNNLRIYNEMYILQESFWDPQLLLRQYKIADFEKTIDANKNKRLADFIQNFNHVDNARLPSQLVGLGPYSIVEWSTGSSITLVKKNNWWGKNNESVYDKQYPDKIIFRVIKDMEPVVLSLKKEQIDLSTELSTPALNKLRRLDYFNDNYKSDYLSSFIYAYMGLNMKPSSDRKPFFVDKKVRRAIAHLTPVDEIIEVLAKGKANRMTSFILPMQDDYNHNLPLIDLDIENAKRLLDEAGWIDSDGDNIRDKVVNGVKIKFAFTLNYMTSPVTKEIGLMIKETMYKAGIQAITNPMDFSVFYKKATEQDFDAMLGSWSSAAGPEDPRQIWHSSSWETKGSNFVGFGNAKSDSLIEIANITLDAEKRKEIMYQLQEMVYDEQPYVFIYNATKKAAIHKRFENNELYTEKPHVILNNLKLSESYLHQPLNY